MLPTIVVVGLGKIGLTIAAQYAQRGYRVIGGDIDPTVIATVNAGRSHVVGEQGLEGAVREAVEAGRLTATSDITDAASRAGTVVVIVPVMLDQAAGVDFSRLDQATAAVGRGLSRGALVIYETTLPVGTTRGRILPALERASGLSGGSEFSLAFSPERVYSGRIFLDLKRYPKLVGGIDTSSGQRAADFYRAVLDTDVRMLANAETAEFTKLAETSYRDVNIALANQLALYAERRGIDVRAAFEAANTQPFSNLHTPGIGVGGHCIPVYPYFLLQDAQPNELGMLRIGRATNDGMPDILVGRLAQALEGLRGKRVLVLGLSYRGNVKELAYSAALRVIAALREGGATVLANDPHFAADEIAALGAELVSLEPRPAVDAVILQANHREYAAIDWGSFRGLRAVLDGRGVLSPEAIAATGAAYLGVGANPY